MEEEYFTATRKAEKEGEERKRLRLEWEEKQGIKR